ncbi:MAG: type IV pilus assembly protein PilE [Lysobacterales bacterium]|jgi:type IV pilus assembly protein PilE
MMEIMKKLPKKNRWGFTLIELMVVVGIVALLVALSMPSYQQFIRKSKRGEAQKLMLNYANVQEIWRSTHNTYASATDMVPPTYLDDQGNNLYTFAVSGISTTGFTLTATAQGTQALDKDKGQACTALTLTQAALKGPAACW